MTVIEPQLIMEQNNLLSFHKGLAGVFFAKGEQFFFFFLNNEAPLLNI